jgi:hypothetical protein
MAAELHDAGNNARPLLDRKASTAIAGMQHRTRQAAKCHDRVHRRATQTDAARMIEPHHTIGPR